MTASRSSWLKLGICAGALALLAGCGGNSASTPAGNTPAPAKHLRLAFIPKGMQHVYWKSVEAGMRQAEKDANASGTLVSIDWQGPPNEGDRPQQISLVENYVGQGLDGIILCPMDADALVAPAEKATRAGIPLVIVDSGLHYDKIVSFVATDNKKAGALAGEELASELGDKGNVILLRFMPGSESTYDREDGFLETIAKYPNIKILSSNIYAGDTIDKALDKSLNLLNSFKGQIDGIFTPNEPTTTGMLLALKNMGLAGQLKFVGFDGGDTNMKGLRDGEINALVLQNPYKMGYTGVQVMLDHLAGKPVPPRVDTGTMLVTLANINTPPVQDLLSHTVQQ